MPEFVLLCLEHLGPIRRFLCIAVESYNDSKASKPEIARQLLLTEGIKLLCYAKFACEFLI